MNMVNGRDLPIVKLVPRNKRQVSKKHYQRIEASLRAVGLLEPLVVYDLGNSLRDTRWQPTILDSAWSWVWRRCRASSGRNARRLRSNRMVNRLSAAEEMRMLRKSLEELDEKTIAAALGLVQRIGHRLNDGLLKQLDPKVVRAFEAGKT